MLNEQSSDEDSLVVKEVTLTDDSKEDEYNPKEYVKEEPDSPTVLKSTRAAN